MFEILLRKNYHKLSKETQIAIVATYYATAIVLFVGTRIYVHYQKKQMEKRNLETAKAIREHNQKMIELAAATGQEINFYLI